MLYFHNFRLIRTYRKSVSLGASIFVIFPNKKKGLISSILIMVLYFLSLFHAYENVDQLLENRKYFTNFTLLYRVA